MKRQIKFRVWEVHSHKYSKSPFSFRLNKNWELSIPNDSFDSQRWEFIYQRFSGLLDSKGKEIYEGDILSKKWRGTVFVCRHTGAFKILLTAVCGENKEMNLFDYIVARQDALMSEDNKDCEVIGNIFENPELLK